MGRLFVVPGDYGARMQLEATGRATEIREIAPTHCPNGHELRPPNVRVGYAGCPCAGAQRGHRTYWCIQCGEYTYVPAHDGPAPFTEQGRWLT